jgi:hypothetical protein
MNNGWIKLHRNLLEWEWYDDINTSRLFIHLLLTANHKDNNWRGIEIKRGSRLTSLDKLAKETGLTVSKIRTSIKKLISTQEIASKSHSQHTVFIMKNYDTYQSDDKQIANESQTVSKRIATNKKDKNVKNVKNIDLLQQIADEFTAKLPELGRVKVLSDKRKAHIKASIKQFKGTEFDFEDLNTWSRLFDYISKSDFLMGRKSDFSASFDFVINKTNLIKITEGQYAN